MDNNFVQVPGFSIYFVSPAGHIWSTHKKGFIKEIIMPNGYHRVVLSKDNKSYNYLVHRLVAEAFVPNPEQKPCVNHIDCNPGNNNRDNLEWVTYKENNNHADHGRKNGLAHSKPVVKIDKATGESVAYYESTRAAAKANNLSATNIASVCSHKPHYHTVGGYRWEWAGGDNEK